MLMQQRKMVPQSNPEEKDRTMIERRSRIRGVCGVTLALLVFGVTSASRTQAQTQTQKQTQTTQQQPPATTSPRMIPQPAPDAYAEAPETPAEHTALMQWEAQAAQKLSSARTAWNAAVTPDYNDHFGADQPFAPGNLQVEGKGFLQPGAYPSAEYCGACHQVAYRQWRESLHANSFRSPFYRRSVNLLIHDPKRGIAFARHCDSCHNPIAVLAGGLTEKSVVNRTEIDGDGLTCMTCHSVVKVGAPEGNAQLTMGVPSVMVDANGNRIPGEVPYAMILRYPKRHAQAVMHDFLHTPEFCAACHKANFPNTLNNYKFLRAFTTYDEWQLSKYSQRNPLTFYRADFNTCQGCHMKRVEAVGKEPGAKGGTLASHRWLAGNTAVPFYYGYDTQVEKTMAFLRSGFLNVDLFALRDVETGKLTAPLGRTSFRLNPDKTVEAWVVIQNKAIGHSLLPEVRDLYEAWVAFTVTDAAGKTVDVSGQLRADGSLDPNAHIFNNRPVDEQGEFVDNHTVWKIHSVAYDNTIDAGRSVLVRYRFRVPAESSGPLTVTASVKYRHLRESYLKSVLGNDPPAYPVATLATETRTLKIGRNGSTPPGAEENPEWMRWNNAGIALLDQLQYAAAVNAFAHVVRLQPRSPDGYTNVALTEIAWEKYESARVAIRKALALDKTNARALYYEAQLERRSGDREREIAELQEVVRQYPESRDARRELGIAYYQQNELPQAMEQFVALQTIDPDDLAAHYNLAVLNRRMGHQQEAEREQAMLIDEKIDPGAPTYALDYIRAHPEISLETVPWHVHSSDAVPAPDAAAVAAIQSYSARIDYSTGMTMADPCTWINEATAAGLLGGAASVSKQPGACVYTRRDGGVTRKLTLSQEAASGTGSAAERCGAKAESLTGVGTAAALCAVHPGNGAQAVADVRGRWFRVTLTTSDRHDGEMTPEAMRMTAEMAASQVAGNLF